MQHDWKDYEDGTSRCSRKGCGLIIDAHASLAADRNGPCSPVAPIASPVDLSSFRQAYLDFREGLRPAPSLALLSGEDRRAAGLWLKSLEAARGVGPDAKRPPTEELLDTMGILPKSAEVKTSGVQSGRFASDAPNHSSIPKVDEPAYDATQQPIKSGYVSLGPEKDGDGREGMRISSAEVMSVEEAGLAPRKAPDPKRFDERPVTPKAIREPGTPPPDADVVDLEAHRLGSARAAHEQGTAFKFMALPSEDPDEMVGTHDEKVVMVTGELEGLYMSPDDARALGVALIGAALAAEAGYPVHVGSAPDDAPKSTGS